MSPSYIALLIILAIVGLGSFIGFRAGASRKMDLEQWTVANRGFGVILVWLLMAGEVYTTFSFLGASGWAYSRGGPTLYILAYLTLGYVVSFYILPQLWETARAQGLQTQSDFFEKRYGSKALAALVAAVGVVFIVPYLQLQLKGMGIIVEVASFSQIHHTAAMMIGGALVAGFVFTSGVRAVALVSVLKDILLLGAAMVIGLAIPYHWFGGFGPMFREIARIHPAHLTMPGPHTEHGARLVYFHCPPDFIGSLYVAAQFRRQLHRQELRHLAEKCGGDAALYNPAAAYLLRWFCGHSGCPRA